MFCVATKDHITDKELKVLIDLALFVSIYLIAFISICPPQTLEPVRWVSEVYLFIYSI